MSVSGKLNSRRRSALEIMSIIEQQRTSSLTVAAFCHGKMNYFVGQHQMAFLKKDIVIEYQVNKQPKDEQGIEFILFSLNYDLVKSLRKWLNFLLYRRVNISL